MLKHWYKNAIIYSLHVKTFLDADGDGTGDFKGLTRSLDYLAGLGVTCVWLLPFFPSPHKDHGYDITNYLDVDPRYGNLGHFVEFVDRAREKGIRVIIDLVLNHTSIDHPWFQEARRNPKSKYHKYYIWTEKKPAREEKVIFPEKEDSNWEYDHEAELYYYHTFYRHQADLNMANPDVQEEIKYILHFWLRLGISGFRMDAVPHMVRSKGPQKWKDGFQFLKDIRTFTQNVQPDAILLGEVNTSVADYKKFFGDSDQLTMLLNFYLNNQLFLALTRESGLPIAKALRKLPETTMGEQLGTFIRNHDELNLEQLTVKECQEVFQAYAPSQEMRIFERGIRRRLAPMLNNNRKQIKLAYSLLLTLPGTPVLRYGDEIGMGEDLSLEERHSVRTSMQWSDEHTGGFSRNKEVNVPVLDFGRFSYKKVNVRAQKLNRSSLLNWFERAIAARKECLEFGLGDYQVVRTNNDSVVAWCCYHEDGYAFAIHNLSGKRINVRLVLRAQVAANLVECFADRRYDDLFDGTKKKVSLGPYGYRWFRKSAVFT